MRPFVSACNGSGTNSMDPCWLVTICGRFCKMAFAEEASVGWTEPRRAGASGRRKFEHPGGGGLGWWRRGHPRSQDALVHIKDLGWGMKPGFGMMLKRTGRQHRNRPIAYSRSRWTGAQGAVTPYPAR